MPYFGYCAQVLFGATSLLITVIGAIRIVALFVGVTKAYGRLLEDLIDNLGYEWPMIDPSHCKVHPHGAGARGGNQDMSRTKGGQYKTLFGRGWAWYTAPDCC